MAALLTAAGIGGSPAAAQDTFVPGAGDAVVETLRYRPLDRSDVEFRQLRAALRARRDDPELAAAVAERALERSRRDGDPRFLGYAQAALAPWWAAADAPAQVRLAKATILQGVHRFDAALEELDQVVAQRPDLGQAWLTRAAVLQAQGRWVEATGSCARLPEAGFGIVRAACLAELRSLSARVDPRQASEPRQRAAEALRELQRIAAGETGRPGSRSGASAVDGWLQLMIAELAERIGEAPTAETAFRRALAANAYAYTRGAFADFLLDQGRAAEVLALLEGQERIDALLLRLTLAQQALGRPDAARNRDALRARFDAARLRGDSIHQREEARFELELEKRPRAALPLALENWAVQKEPADARLLLEAASAAGQPAAADPVRDLIREHQLYDRRLRVTAR